MLGALTAWWDALELWLAQQWFPVQFTLVMLILAPACTGAAWIIDRVVDYVSAKLGILRRDARQPAPGRE